MATLGGPRPSAFLRCSDAQPEEKVAHSTLLADWLRPMPQGGCGRPPHQGLTHASRRALHLLVAHRKHHREGISHEGLVSHRTAVCSPALLKEPDLNASNTPRGVTER